MFSSLSEHPSVHKRRIHDLYASDTLMDGFIAERNTLPSFSVSRSTCCDRRTGAAVMSADIDSCIQRLSEHYPAPWKEEREAHGLRSRVPRSLTDLLAAPAPASSARETDPSPKNVIMNKILPDDITERTPRELFARTATLLARRIRPGITFSPHSSQFPGNPSLSNQTLAASTSNDLSPGGAVVAQPSSHSSDTQTSSWPRDSLIGGQGLVSHETRMAMSGQAVASSTMVSTEAASRGTEQFVKPIQLQDALTSTASRLSSSSAGDTSLDNGDAPLPGGTSSLPHTAPATTPVQQINTAVLNWRPVKPKTADKSQVIDRVGFTVVLQQCSSSQTEEAQEAIVRLKEIGKGDSGVALVSMLAKEMLAERHTNFIKRVQAEGAVRLESELYVKWLAECQSLVDMMRGLLRICSPGSHRPSHGIGRIAFAFASPLFHFQRNGGLLDVAWQIPSDGAQPRSIVRPATPADDPNITIAAAQIRDKMSEFDEGLHAVIVRYKTENPARGMPMRACEKRLSAALNVMRSRAGLDAHDGCAGWMASSKQALLQWAESAAKRAP